MGAEESKPGGPNHGNQRQQHNSAEPGRKPSESQQLPGYLKSAGVNNVGAHGGSVSDFSKFNTGNRNNQMSGAQSLVYSGNANMFKQGSQSVSYQSSGPGGGHQKQLRPGSAVYGQIKPGQRQQDFTKQEGRSNNRIPLSGQTGQGLGQHRSPQKQGNMVGSYNNQLALRQFQSQKQSPGMNNSMSQGGNLHFHGHNPNDVGAIMNTDGNNSICGQSQQSNGNQSSAEMREYFQYKRQLHTNMTQRVLNQQSLKDTNQQLINENFKQNILETRSLGLSRQNSIFNQQSNRNKPPNSTYGSKLNLQNDDVQSQKNVGTFSLSQATPQSMGKSQGIQINPKSGPPLMKPQQHLTQNNAMSKTFSKVPPKKYKASQNKASDKNKTPKTNNRKEANNTQNNQLLYKIKYINTTQQKTLPTGKGDQQNSTRRSKLGKDNERDSQQQQSILVQKPRRFLKFGGDNCSLDPRIIMTLLEFDMTNFRKFLRLSPSWHHLVLEGIEERMKPVENEFVNLYYEHLFFKKSYTNSSIMYFGGKRGIRVDRILVCEILNQRENVSKFRSIQNDHTNKCLMTSFKYSFTKGSQNMNISTNGQQGGVSSVKFQNGMPEYCADYKMDVKAQGTNRILWMHKDEQEQQEQLKQFQDPFKFDYLQISQLINRPYVQPINQICHGDTVEIAINLFNMQGMIDIDSIKWFPPSLTIPTADNVLNYSNDGKQRAVRDRVLKIFCDTNRVCELEDSVVEWYDSKYYQRQFELMDLSFFEPMFQIKGYMCAGVDGLICKVHLLAQQEGRLVNEYIGMPLVVKEKQKKNQSHNEQDQMQSNTIVHEVKRVGLLIDRYIDLELRVGDHLVLYISKSQA